MITGIRRDSIVSVRTYVSGLSAPSARVMGFAFIRFEFLLPCSVDIKNLSSEDIEVGQGDPLLYIRGIPVEREHYRITFLFCGEYWGYPKYRIADNSVLIEVFGLTKYYYAQMLDSVPSTIHSMSSDERMAILS